MQISAINNRYTNNYSYCNFNGTDVDQESTELEKPVHSKNIINDISDLDVEKLKEEVDNSKFANTTPAGRVCKTAVATGAAYIAVRRCSLRVIPSLISKLSLKAPVEALANKIVKFNNKIKLQQPVEVNSVGTFCKAQTTNISQWLVSKFEKTSKVGLDEKASVTDYAVNGMHRVTSSIIGFFSGLGAFLGLTKDADNNGQADFFEEKSAPIHTNQANVSNTKSPKAKNAIKTMAEIGSALKMADGALDFVEAV